MNPRNVVATVAELAVIALSIVIAIGLERLFVDTSFLADVLVLVVGSHLVALLCRRSGLGMSATTLVSLVTLVVITTALFYGETAWAFVPTSDTLDAFRDDLSAAWEVYGDESAPVAAIPGLVAAAGIILWWIAFLADWAAFRLRSPLEAVAPAAAVFVFTALLGDPRHQVAHGAFFAAGVAGVLLAMRAERQVREEVWVASGAARGVGATLRVGAAAGAVAVLAGAIGGPAIPGAGDPALIDITNINAGSNSRVVISPLVEVSASLVQLAEFEIFSVAVDDPTEDRDYWRLMALTEFDGDIWRRSSNFDDVRGPVDSDIADDVDRRLVRQTITTRRLGNIYLPAASEIAEIVDDGGIGLEYETATGALVVRDEDQARAEAGFTYIIDSAVPDFDPATLPDSATDGLDGDFIDEHTQLPEDCRTEQSAADGCWPAAVTDLARQVTAGAQTDLQRAQLLQNHFLDPTKFTYDLDVAAGHNVESIEDFLSIGRGYCEQFASTFAAMARSIGLPTRVAVGFTWGDWDETRQEFIVRGENAHAWPEVYFADAGWITFDPTPGRNRPHDADITTNTAPAQLGEGDEINYTDTNPLPEPTLPTAPPAGESPSGFEELGGGDTVTPEPPPEVDGHSGSAVPRFLLVVGVVLAAAAAIASTVPLTRTLVRRRALARVAANPVGRGELAWDDAVDALRLVDLRHRPNETPIEFAARVSARARFDVGPFDNLARRVTLLRYGTGDNAVEHAVQAQSAAADVRRVCQTLAGRRRVIADTFDPRNVRPAT